MFDKTDAVLGVVMTIGGLIMIFASIKPNKKDNNLKEYLRVTSQDLETVEETREIIANTLEHFDSNIKKTAEALKMPQYVVNTILEDKDKVLAFNDHILRKSAKHYRQNVATSDALTGLLNKGGFMTALKAAGYEPYFC